MLTVYKHQIQLSRHLDDAASVNTDVTIYSPTNDALNNISNVKLR